MFIRGKTNRMFCGKQLQEIRFERFIFQLSRGEAVESRDFSQHCVFDAINDKIVSNHE